MLAFITISGDIYLVEEDFSVFSFNAYEKSASHVKLIPGKNLLFTIGNDNESAYPVLKIWNIQKRDGFYQTPTCMKNFTIQYGDEANAVTSLVVSIDVNFIGVGLNNGVVLYINGNISTGRFSKWRALHLDGKDKGAITNLGLEVQRSPDGHSTFYIYLTTVNRIRSYIIVGSQSHVEFTEDQGCALNCASMNDQKEFVVSRSEAIYLYSRDIRGSCFVLDGLKFYTYTFGQYLAVIGESKSKFACALSIYDLRNKIVAYTGLFGAEVQHLIYQWQALYVFTSDKKIFKLTEKDIKTRLEFLYQKNLYSLAKEMAIRQNLPKDLTNEISKRYAEHLYLVGDFDEAITQYIDTIGWLEPSSVIRKYLDSQKIHNLTIYLKALHEKGLASTDHTNLLLLCYTKLNDSEKLENFIKTERNIKFDIEKAIKICRSSGNSRLALYIAQRYEDFDSSIQIQIEDLEDYDEAIDFLDKMIRIESLSFVEKYGGILMTHSPEKMTQLLLKICCEERAETAASPNQSPSPEDFLQLFVHNTLYLENFVKKIVESCPDKATSAVWNTMIEIQLKYSMETGEGDPVMEILKNDRAKYDAHQVLISCKLFEHNEGTLYLLEKLGMYKDILQHCIEKKDSRRVLDTCRKFGNHEMDLWSTSLAYFAKQGDSSSNEIFEILKIIDEKRIMSPFKAVEILSREPKIKLKNVMDFLLCNVKRSEKSLNESRRLIESYQAEISKLTADISKLEARPIVFKAQKCSMCSTSLDLPALYFLCNHSFHIR